MSYLRLLMRRLDPWAALLLGASLAMGVVILLATPGPWHRVGGPRPPVKLSAHAPRDVAVFTLSGRNGACSGVVWLHVDPSTTSLAAVVVPRKVVGFVEDGGYAPLASIVDEAGPSAAAAALGDALGVDMDAWVALDREAVRAALGPMFPMLRIRPARGRYVAAERAWRGRGNETSCLRAQYRSLCQGLPRAPIAGMSVVAFSNYVLGFGFARSSFSLQGVTSLAQAMKEAAPQRRRVGVAPVLIEECRGGSVWTIDRRRLAPVLRAYAEGQRLPVRGPTVARRQRRAEVVVVASLPRSPAAAYASEVRRRLHRFAGGAISVRLVAGNAGALVARTQAALRGHQALAVLIAPTLSGTDAETTTALEQVCSLLRRRHQDAVVAAPLPVRAVSVDGSTTATADRGTFDASGLPTSPFPTTVARGSMTAMLRRAARANVQTLVRACWPSALAPRLTSTRIGFSYAGARHTEVGVVAVAPAEARWEDRLRVWGYVPGRLDAKADGWLSQQPRGTLYYQREWLRAATALAGDLGLTRSALVVVADAPRPLVLVVGKKALPAKTTTAPP